VAAAVVILLARDARGQAPQPTVKQSLLKNPGFELGGKDWRGFGRTKTEEKDNEVDCCRDAHAGKVSLKILNRRGSAGATQFVAVETNAQYTLLAFVKCAEEIGDGFARLLVRGKDYCDLGATPQHRSPEWKKLVHSFVAGPEDGVVRIICNVRGPNVTAFFDDLLLIKGKPSEVSGLNLLYNSSFEFETTPHLPDGFGCYLCSCKSDKFFSNWHLDYSNAFDGSKSMFLDNPFEGTTHRFKLNSTRPMYLTPGASHVISFYGKSRQPGCVVKLAGMFDYSSGSAFTLTTNWTRHSTWATAWPVVKRKYRGHGLAILTGPGACWIDAVMVEEGAETSPYARMPREEPLITPSIEQGQTGPVGLPPDEADAAVVPHRTGEPPFIHAEKALGVPPAVDGRLDEKCWKQAGRVLLDKELEGRPITQGTEAYVLLGTTELYIGVSCHDSDIANLKKDIKEHDDAVWTDDSVEVFISSRHDHKDLYQIVVNADGVTFDTHNKATTWDPHYQVRTHVGKTEWTAEFGLPYSIFDPVELDELVWGISICRENHKASEYSYWGGPFVDAANMGHLIGLDRTTLARYMFRLTDVSVVLDRINPEKADVTCTIRNPGNAAPLRAEIGMKGSRGADLGKYEVTVEAPAQGGFSTVFRNVDLPLTAPPVFAVLTLFEATSGNRLKAFGRRALSLPCRPRLYPYLSFFSSEDKMSVILDIGEVFFPRGTRIDATLTDEMGKVCQGLKAEHVPGRQSHTFEFDSSSLGTGKYTARADVALADGTAITLATTVLKQRFVANETKVCNKSRALWVQGKEFFPIGLTYHYDRDPDRAQWLRYLLDVRRHHFNTIEATYKPTPEGLADTKAFMALAAELGLKVFLHISPEPTEEVNPDTDSDWKKKMPPYIAGIERMVPLYREHPQLIGWHLIDEIHLKQLRNGGGDQLVTACRRLDPHHISYMNLLGSPRRNRQTFEVLSGRYPGDVLSSTGSYSVPNVPITRLSDVCDILMQSQTPKPLYPWVQSWSGTGRCPNPAEMRGMVYLAVIHGATGYKFWPGPTNSEATWEATGRVNREMLSLAPVILSEDYPFESSDDFVHVLAKKHKSKLHLITVNSLNHPHRARLDISHLEAARSVRTIFESRTVKVEQEAIVEVYEPFGRRVYVIDGEW